MNFPGWTPELVRPILEQMHAHPACSGPRRPVFERVLDDPRMRPVYDEFLRRTESRGSFFIRREVPMTANRRKKPNCQLVAPKREFPRTWPETFADFLLEIGEPGNQRQKRMRKKPGFSAHFRVSWEASPNGGQPGWRRSGIRTSLHANSLLTGNFTGNSAILGLLGLI